MRFSRAGGAQRGVHAPRHTCPREARRVHARNPRCVACGRPSSARWSATWARCRRRCPCAPGSPPAARSAPPQTAGPMPPAAVRTPLRCKSTKLMGAAGGSGGASTSSVARRATTTRRGPPPPPLRAHPPSPAPPPQRRSPRRRPPAPGPLRPLPGESLRRLRTMTTTTRTLWRLAARRRRCDAPSPSSWCSSPRRHVSGARRARASPCPPFGALTARLVLTTS